MDLNDVFDRAYENAMRQGYFIDTDVLRACIDAVSRSEPPFEKDELVEALTYIKEKPELLPTSMEDVEAWRRRWTSFFDAAKRWNAEGYRDIPPLLCDYGL
ncbi:MAG TPA: hypothetical protein PLO37_25955 [Candidatus Hydrogenedentes bacterium]|nr:hypothetical protein [Candidatus Hydrogenedentota bacterium]HPG70302.1 hypothetical protein [Candidatus Hydrogenedentota bacterium]